MDIYAQYEIGLNVLLRHLPSGHPRYEEVIDYQQQLKTNLTNMRRYDDDDQGERLWILEQLDEVAREVTRRSFHELCSQRPSMQVPDEHYLVIGVVASLVAAASGLGLVQFWQGSHTTLSTLLLGGGVLAGWLGYLYVAFRERDTGALREESAAYEEEDVLPGMGRSVRVKVAYYPAWLRRLALLSVLVISMLTLVVIQ